MYSRLQCSSITAQDEWFLSSQTTPKKTHFHTATYNTDMKSANMHRVTLLSTSTHQTYSFLTIQSSSMYTDHGDLNFQDPIIGLLLDNTTHNDGSKLHKVLGKTTSSCRDYPPTVWYQALNSHRSFTYITNIIYTRVISKTIMSFSVQILLLTILYMCFICWSEFLN